MSDALGAINTAKSNIPTITIDDVGGSSAGAIEQAYKPVESAFDQYAGRVLGNEKPLDLYNRLEAQAGIPEMRQTSSTLRSQIGKTEDTLRGIEPDITNRTQNSLVTEAQRRGMVTAESKPLQEFLDRISTALGRNEQSLTAAGQGISNKVGLQLQGDQIQNEVYRERVSLQADKAARMITGFTEDRQLRYSMLQDKLNKGFELTKMEIAELSELASDERRFAFEKDQQTRQYDLALRNDKEMLKAKGSGVGDGNGYGLDLTKTTTGTKPTQPAEIVNTTNSDYPGPYSNEYLDSLTGGNPQATQQATLQPLDPNNAVRTQPWQIGPFGGTQTIDPNAPNFLQKQLDMWNPFNLLNTKKWGY